MNELKGWYKRKNLPHLDCDEVIQFITYRLFDSVPKDQISRWRDELEITDLTTRCSTKYKQLLKRISEYEDSGYGACYLKNSMIYDIVKNSFLFYDGRKYDLIKWVIMPNHIHIVIKQKPGVSLPTIIQNWKSYTSSEANKILNRKGEFWMDNYYDTYIRDDEHLEAVIKYIDKNIALLEKIQG